jgi:oligoendopeptidase F
MNWDLSDYFPAFDGPEYRTFKEKLRQDIDTLTAQAAALPVLDTTSAAGWEAVFLSYEDLSARMSHIGSYIGCLSSTDARNEAYGREDAELDLLGARSAKLGVELKRALKDCTDADFDAFTRREALDATEHYLGRMRQDARRSMSPDKEVLAADLGVDGINAWGRLYDTVSGKLEFDMEYPDGRSERLPVAQRRSLMGNSDRRIRQAAFDRGNQAWAGVEDVTAAAINAIAGTRLNLNRHRQVDHFLDIALFQASISRQTLDAMFEAIDAEIELPRRILDLKSQAQGTNGVAWYDLEAPLPLPEQDPVTWEACKELVADSFTKAYPLLGQFTRDMYAKEWIEWEPRPGKRPGAFCTSTSFINQSRIYMTFNQATGDVRTLAHEAGHAFHSYILRDQRPFSRRYPMTLAESASTFGEMLLTEGLLSSPDISPLQKARILDIETAHAAVFLLDIPVRYRFEKRFHEERQEGEVSVTRLKELMTQTQCQVFGPALDPNGTDPYFWASKLHFYITGTTFYNFPYTFGFLLSRGLFARFQQEGAAFLPRYEDFLRLTGRAGAEEVARQSIGVDLEKPEFWRDAIRTLDAPLAQLEELLPAVLVK